LKQNNYKLAQLISSKCVIKHVTTPFSHIEIFLPQEIIINTYSVGVV
jgi:hypothetical protein